MGFVRLVSQETDRLSKTLLADARKDHHQPDPAPLRCLDSLLRLSVHPRRFVGSKVTRSSHLWHLYRCSWILYIPDLAGCSKIQEERRRCVGSLRRQGDVGKVQLVLRCIQTRILVAFHASYCLHVCQRLRTCSWRWSWLGTDCWSTYHRITHAITTSLESTICNCSWQLDQRHNPGRPGVIRYLHLYFNPGDIKMIYTDFVAVVFVEKLGIAQSTKTITGVVLIAVQSVLTGVLAILITVNAIIMCCRENPHRKRRKEAGSFGFSMGRR